MQRRVLAVVIATVLAVAAVFTGVMPEIYAAQPEWKRLYRDYIMDKTASWYYSYFYLIDLDLDGIPELVHIFQGDGPASSIYHISDNTVKQMSGTNLPLGLGEYDGNIFANTAVGFVVNDADGNPCLVFGFQSPFEHYYTEFVYGELRKNGDELEFTQRYRELVERGDGEDYWMVVNQEFYDLRNNEKISKAEFRNRVRAYISSFDKNETANGKYAALIEDDGIALNNYNPLDLEILTIYSNNDKTINRTNLDLFLDSFSVSSDNIGQSEKNPLLQECETNRRALSAAQARYYADNGHYAVYADMLDDYTDDKLSCPCGGRYYWDWWDNAADPAVWFCSFFDEQHINSDAELKSIIDKIGGMWVDKRYYENETIDDSVVFARELRISSDGAELLFENKNPAFWSSSVYSETLPLSIQSYQNGVAELIYDVTKLTKFQGMSIGIRYGPLSPAQKRRYADWKISVATNNNVVDEIRLFADGAEYIMVPFDALRDPSRFYSEQINQTVKLVWHIQSLWDSDAHHPDCVLRLYRSEVFGERGVKIWEKKNLLWEKWDYKYVDYTVEQGKTYYYSLWLYGKFYSSSETAEERQILIAGDWQMKVEVPGDAPQETNPAPYIYTAPAASAFSSAPGVIAGITTPDTAREAISDAISNLTAQQKQSGDALDDLTLFIETAARKGAVMDAKGSADITAQTLNELASTANSILTSAQVSLALSGVELLREPRVNVTVRTNETQRIEIAFSEDVSNAFFDKVTIEAQFAHITLNKDYIANGGGVVLRLLSQGETEAFSDSLDVILHSNDAAETGNNGGETEFSVFDFWSAGVAAFIILIWGILRVNKKRLRTWVVPTFCAIAVGMNYVTYTNNNVSQNNSDGGGMYTAQNNAQTELTAEFPEGSDTNITAVTEITLTEGTKITLCLPATGENKDSLILFDENGEPQYSKYNPLTDTIDASVKKSGIYALYEYNVDFADMEKKNDIMKEAVTQLASRGIMHGTTDGFFYPDKPITRAEFVQAIIGAFDMLDPEAENVFTDIEPDDWYYHAAATARQDGLITGFPDNTFRGELDIPKAQLVVISANTLQEKMGYKMLSNIEDELLRYADNAELAEWSKPGIALATRNQIMLHREDNLFAPESVMTRGDAAIILYRVFGKVW